MMNTAIIKDLNINNEMIQLRERDESHHNWVDSETGSPEEGQMHIPS